MPTKINEVKTVNSGRCPFATTAASRCFYWADRRHALFFVAFIVLCAFSIHCCYGLDEDFYNDDSGMLVYARGGDCLGDSISKFGASFHRLAIYSSKLNVMAFGLTLAMLQNVVIVFVHLTIPPHPKYALLPVRSFAIKLHVFSGILEILSSLLAWFYAGGDYVLLDSLPAFGSLNLAKLMAVSSALHAISGVLMIPVVYGVQFVSIPGYIFICTLKMIQAVNVFNAPDCYLRVMSLAWIHSTYAWFRLCWYFMRKFDIMEAHAYSVAIICSLTIVLPLLGSWVTILLFAFMGLYTVSFYTVFPEAESLLAAEETTRTFDLHKIHLPCLDDEMSGHQEENVKRRQNNLLKLREAAIQQQLMQGKKEGCISDREKAELVFKAIDIDNSGTISFSELAWTLHTCGVPIGDTAAIMVAADTDGDKCIELDEFEKYFHAFYMRAYEDMTDAVDFEFSRGKKILKEMRWLHEEQEIVNSFRLPCTKTLETKKGM